MALPMVTKDLEADADAIKSTSSTITSIESKLIRSACVNNVVTDFAVLSEYSYRRQLAHLIRLTEGLKVWQGDAAKTNRDETRSRNWLVKVCSDSFLEHQKTFADALRDPDVLRKCGFSDFCQISTAISTTLT